MWATGKNQRSIWNKQLFDASSVSFSNGKDKGADKKEEDINKFALDIFY